MSLEAVDGPIPVPLPAVIADSPLAVLMLAPSIVVAYNLYSNWSTMSSEGSVMQYVVTPLVVGYAAGYVVARFFNQPPFVASLAAGAIAYASGDIVYKWFTSKST
jgi:hypothetical protein